MCILEIILMFLEIENVKGPFSFFLVLFLNSQTSKLINFIMLTPKPTFTDFTHYLYYVQLGTGIYYEYFDPLFTIVLTSDYSSRFYRNFLWQKFA